MADIGDCCQTIKGFFEDLEEAAQTAFDGSVVETQDLLDIANDGPGIFVPTSGGDLPTMSETVGRIHNFGGGFSAWSFVASDARTVVNLPASIVNAGKVHISLNGARLADTVDYSIAASVLTMTDPLEVGDWLTAKTYGDN